MKTPQSLQNTSIQFIFSLPLCFYTLYFTIHMSFWVCHSLSFLRRLRDTSWPVTAKNATGQT